MSIGTGDDRTTLRAAVTPATNFSVVRVKHDILRRSSIGVIGTNRSVSQSGGPAAQAYGVDGTFGFFQNLTINTYWARTSNPGVHRDDTSYRAQLEYNGDKYGATFERLAIGDNFNPEVGFVRRDNQHRSYGLLRYSPRLRSRSIRKLS